MDVSCRFLLFEQRAHSVLACVLLKQERLYVCLCSWHPFATKRCDFDGWHRFVTEGLGYRGHMHASQSDGTVHDGGHAPAWTSSWDCCCFHAGTATATCENMAAQRKMPEHGSDSIRLPLSSHRQTDTYTVNLTSTKVGVTQQGSPI
jgi:hypothetical protein